MSKRPLTAGEIALCKSLFRDSIDYDQVRVTPKPFHPFQPKGTAMTPNGCLYMHGCYEDDFSAGDLATRGHFIHEMTHVWQHQNKVFNVMKEGMALVLKGYSKAYDYTLDPQKDLLDYGMEQQADILRHYYQNPRAEFLPVLKKFLENPKYALTVARFKKNDIGFGRR